MEDFSKLRKNFDLSILMYIFNFSEEQHISLINKLKVKLNLNQKKIYLYINELIKRQRESRYTKGEDNLLDIEQILFFLFREENGLSLANKYNKICGGNYYLHTSTGDALFDYIADNIDKFYPKILTKKFIRNCDNLLNMDELIDIISKDDIFKLLKKSKENEYIIAASLFDKDGNRVDKIEKKLNTAFELFFSICFENCIYKLDISREALLEEVKEGIEFLRKLALRKSLSCSTFVGVHGIGFHNFSEIDLGDLIVRNISNKDLTENLSLKTVAMILNHEDVKLYGVSIEGKHILKSISKKEKKLRDRYVDTVGETLLNEVMEKIEIFYFVILILKNKINCLEISFKSVGYYFKTSYYIDGVYSGQSKLIPIYENEIDEIKKMYHLIMLNLKNKSIYNVVHNLKLALLKGSDINDSIMSAFYAWESMFSQTNGTTKYICNAIAVYINRDEKRINDLYDRYRSSRAHGELFKINKEENIYEIQNEVINIGIECFKKLIEDKELVKLNASTRARKLMKKLELD